MTAPGNTIFRSRVPLGTFAFFIWCARRKVGTMASLQTFKMLLSYRCLVFHSSGLLQSCPHEEDPGMPLSRTSPRHIDSSSQRRSGGQAWQFKHNQNTTSIKNMWGFWGNLCQALGYKMPGYTHSHFSSATIALCRRVSSSDAAIHSNRTSAKISDLKKHAQR